MSKLKEYHILHAELPSFTEEPQQKRKCVGSVFAESIEDAFLKSQNHTRHWNIQKPCRSTSIGDVIQDDGVDYIVAGVGFKALVEVCHTS